LIAENLDWREWLRWTIARSSRYLVFVSGAVWAITMPLVMARFHLFTPIAVVLNTLAWLPMALGLTSGAVLLVIGTIAPPVAQACGFFCNFSFWLTEWLVTAFRRIPGSHFWAPGPADWWLWGFYSGLALLAAFPRIRPPRRWFVALLAGWIAVGFAAAAWRHDSSRLDCTFLSMGHGCAVLLKLPSGQTVLYDAGQMGAPSTGSLAIAEALWAHGTTHLDAVVLSHSDVDHYNALPGLLEKFSAGAVYVSPVMFEKENQAMAALRTAIERHGVPICEIRAGDCLRGGDGCVLEVLHPSRHGILGSDNANSLVLSVEYLGRRILLTGDLESPGLDDLLTEEPQPCDVLMAPHHGSRHSHLPGLAAWCKPRWVVFSGDGRWTMPEAELPYRAVGGQVLHTFVGWAIQVRIDAAGVGVSEFLKSTTP
jgi:competence protein ComEC